MKIKKTMNNIVLVNEKMIIVPEVLDFTDTLLQKGNSLNTVRSYLRDLKAFYEWLAIAGNNFYDVTPRDLKNFIKFIDTRHFRGKVSPATLSRYMATLSSFYKHHELMGWNVENPVLKIQTEWKHPESNKSYLKHITNPLTRNVRNYFKRKKKKKIDKKRLTAEQALGFYNSIDLAWNDDTDLLIRNKLIFKVLYETGMRIGELLHLQLDDVEYPQPNKKTGNIYLIDREEVDEERQLKTGERTIPVTTGLLKEVDDYIMSIRPQKEDIKYIFVSHHGKTEGCPISRNAVEDFFSLVSFNSKVKCTPHALRHTHASNLADMGLDILVIKDRLGHASIETTTKYSKPSLETQILSYERYLNARKDVI
ncbi:transposase [Paenibacillus marchantiophytorum]|uniref:Transposase n=1 Tax=Paenibacillus marchantiophytorum TaxID=1619310 RepID=A0ABQ1EU15_9BACL|nr:tyrosine-type recombinase/integrase [Paenibacillus marchantiophytorum]GFZ87363.1 transposase [Paenibacillus marchantiophytorum]